MKQSPPTRPHRLLKYGKSTRAAECDRLPRAHRNLQAVNTVQLRARVEGYLEKILFQDGQSVKKDQLLFIIQQNTYLAKLQQAEGNVLAQKASLARGEIELARYSNLYTQRA